jgi:hypothetical protein
MRESSPRRVKISLLWKRTMRRSALRQLREKGKKKDMATSSELSMLLRAVLCFAL